MSYHTTKTKYTSVYRVTIHHNLPLATMGNQIENRLGGMNCDVADVVAVMQPDLPASVGNIVVPAEAQSSHTVEGHDPEICIFCIAAKVLANGVYHGQR